MAGSVASTDAGSGPVSSRSFSARICTDEGSTPAALLADVAWEGGIPQNVDDIPGDPAWWHDTVEDDVDDISSPIRSSTQGSAEVNKYPRKI